MANRRLAVYRLPIPSATSTGHVRVVIDRNGKCYIDGSRVEAVVTSGIHTTLKLADGRAYHVLTADYQKLR